MNTTTRSAFTVEMSDNVALVIDRNGEVSVTNDAENVLARVCQKYPETQRVLYKDSQGQWDELKFIRDKRANLPIFKGFAPISNEEFVKFELHSR